MTDIFKQELLRRPRRLRRNPTVRALVRETSLKASDLIAPLFVEDGDGPPQAVESMPGVYRFSIRDLVRECRELHDLGVRAVALFPRLDQSLKNDLATAALDPDTLVLRAVRSLKVALPDLVLMTDIALDPYTTHGHDGVLTKDGGDVDNDRTVGILVRMALLHAQAGVDFVAPSDMMDGRVGAIRRALEAADCSGIGILAYSAKFASAYYGPFREAVGSATAAGKATLDKGTYQLDPANRREALVEAALDAEEGADILMVKPAGPYLDIIREIKDATDRPLAAYQVSGEYAQIQAAARLGWLDLVKTRDESLMAIKRAGADLILTYFAKEMARSLRANQ
jgi:porphobilinogen synthase